MATSQTIHWVALPGGSIGEGADRKLRVSVFVSPRLRADAGQDVLDSFPDFRDWPAVIAGLTFNVEVEHGPTIPAQVAGPAPESDLWTALFTAATPVESFRFDDFADRPFVTFSLRDLLTYLQESYAQAAMATDNLPLTYAGAHGHDENSLAQIFEDLRNVTQSGLMEGLPDDEELGRRIGALIGRARQESAARQAHPAGVRQPPILVDAGGDGTVHHFAQASLFYRRLAGQKPVDLPNDDEAPQHFKDRIDFHQMLSALGDYPLLLRRLGLVVDLEIDAAALPETPDVNQPGKLRVVSPERPAEVSPWTVYAASVIQDRPFFFAAARHSPLLLALNDQDYLVNQVDVDGAALKAINMAITLQHQTQESQRPIEEPDRAGVPALRTGGVSLVRNGAVNDLHGGFLVARDLNETLEGGGDATLWAEDLTRGYRMDVYDSATGKWRSLHQRIATYDPLDYAPGSFDLPDEGFTQLSATGPASPHDAPPDPTSEIYVHDALFTWDGWSLSAPRPGKSINRNLHAPDAEHPEAAPERVDNRAMTAMRLEVTAHVQPGSLPRLRFEHGYRVRVRTVDLAGGGVTPAETDAILALLGEDGAVLPADDLRYARFEPVAGPTLVPRAHFAEGESLDRIVIRSEAGIAATDYAAGDPARYTDSDERHLAAPKVPLALIEAHGLLDAAIGAGGQAAAEVYALMTARESATLNDPGPEVEPVHQDGDPAKPVVYAIHHETQLEIPYLPDPLALGVLFMGLPGADPATPLRIEFGGPEWYQPTPFRLKLMEGGGAPAWDAAARVLSVQLPKAQVATIRAMSLMPEGYFQNMGLLQWCEQALARGKLSAVEFDAIARAMEENRHWMLTPWREIMLVHAVQHPLEPPNGEIMELSADDPPVFARNPETTAAELKGFLEVDFPSTVRLDLDAVWEEPSDIPSQGAPRYGPDRLSVAGHVLDIALPPDGEEPLIANDSEILAFRDGRVVEFDAHWEGRPPLLRDLRSQLGAANLTSQQRDDLRRRIEILEQVKPHEFGDTKYRRVRYTFTATSRFREYFPPEITSRPEDISLSGPETTVDMLSSASPGAPGVLYAIPTWRWETADDPDTGARASIRRGGSLRVYLKRPWFSSGDGELLAAVLRSPQRGGLVALGDEYYKFVTAFGQDPLFASAVPATPGPESFKNPLATATGLPLVEPGGLQVAVAGFGVEYDASRDLWYCDIEMDTEGAYFPFVRLALARYQPHSIPRAHLSPVVLADIVQTAPDRTLTVTPVAGQAGAFAVQVSGPAYTATRQLTGQVQPGASQIIARLETRDPVIGDEALGWDAVAGVVETLGSQVAADNVSATWTGQIAIPEAIQGQHVRLVVEEYQQLPAENLPDHPGEFTVGGRLVYADVMEV